MTTQANRAIEPAKNGQADEFALMLIQMEWQKHRQRMCYLGVASILCGLLMIASIIVLNS